ncbi:glycosyltransferase family 4 protein [Dysgonomonas sp. 520]|uniref:glycosyltransferase family 4 protein n=1 Tax=Dysgonomonas sp. 520 TaxID=2302931 RepID=UPI0013D07677|nr:glycosyltransferase family 4 protein [Dysgonomonas sp. 520]NDW10664.1 glycosyltransferase [Dysgonomonas sp. 520]
MNIAYISRFESVNIKNWSGTEYFIAEAIGSRLGNHLDIVAGLQERLDIWTRIKYQVNFRMGRKYSLNRSPYVVKQYAKQVEHQLKGKDIDIIFSPGVMPIAHLETNTPKVFYTDATFASMVNYYDWYTDLSKITINEGNRLDQIAIDTSNLAIFSSEWAAQSAINDYGASPDKVKVVPLGANIEKEPELNDIKNAISNRSKDVCKIVFIGVDWIRKGGDTVFRTVKELNNSGLETELHTIGITKLPADVQSEYFVFNHGFIDKSTPSGLSELEKIISDCHFLFVPSHAEAYGLVFCEASAYGLPSIATRTGGIPTIVKDDLNGHTFNLDSCISEYAEYIYNVFNNKKMYAELALSSYNEYKTRLNWDVAGRILNKYMKELL